MQVWQKNLINRRILLSPTRAKILGILMDRRGKQPPSVRELCKLCRISPNAACGHLLALRHDGLINMVSERDWRGANHTGLGVAGKARTAVVAVEFIPVEDLP